MFKKICLVTLAAVILTSAAGCGTETENDSSPAQFSVTVSDQMNKYILQSPDINEDKWVQEINSGANAKVTFNFLDHQEIYRADFSLCMHLEIFPMW